VDGSKEASRGNVEESKAGNCHREMSMAHGQVCVLARWVRALFVAVAAFWVASVTAQVQYVYDELGRLVQVVTPNGESIQYDYDATGNISAIRKLDAAAISLSEFTPNTGPAGTSVNLYGTGFSSTAANNTVKFNGTTAAVTAATTTSLTVTVPAGATTGRITVTASAKTATSTTDFVVAAGTAPKINSFSPDIGNVSTLVAINGANFQTEPKDNKTAIGGRAAAVTKDANSPAANLLKISVPLGLPSGKVSVTTPYGTAVSSTDFYALPTGVSPTDVEFKGRLTVNGTALNVSIATPGKKAVILLDGQAGQKLHFVTASGTFAASITAQVYSPDGRLVQSSSLSNAGTADFTGPLAGNVATGTYTVILSPGASDKGAVSLSVIDDVTGELKVDGRTPVSISGGRNARYSFVAEAGKGYGLALANLSTTPAGSTVTATLRKLDGTLLDSCTFSAPNDCDEFVPKDITVPGTYYIDFDPTGTASATFEAVFSKDAGSNVTVDAATATTVNIAREGQNGRYTFNATAGQNVSIVLTNNALKDDDTTASNTTYVYLYKPSNPDTSIGSTSLSTATVSGTINAMALPETGTYTIFINPDKLDSGKISLQVKSYLAGNLKFNGRTTISLTEGRNARYSINADAGKGYGLALTDLSTAPAGVPVTATLRKADGYLLFTCSFSAVGDCDFAPKYFTATDTYYIDFDPADAAAATFDVLFSKDAGSNLTVDAVSATTVNIDRAGQNGRYTFSAPAGQNISIVLSNNLLKDGDTTASNTTNFYLYAPSNTDTGSTSSFLKSTSLSTGTNSGIIDVTSLPETGTYTIYIDPNKLDEGTISVQVKSYLSGDLTVNGRTAIALSEGRNARYGFTAEAGKGYGLALTNLVTTPPGSEVIATLRRTDGTFLASCSFSAAGDCDFAPTYFDITFTYYIDFDPKDAAAATFDAVFSKDVGGNLKVDAATATTVNIAREGQNGRYTFSATAGQNISIVLTNNALDDGDSLTSNNTYLYLYKPSNPDSWLTYTYFSTGTISKTLDVTALPETGSYTIFITPDKLDKGTIDLRVITR
jgi:large repetitive protein